MSGCCGPFVPDAGGGAAGGGGDDFGVNVQDEGVALPNNPHTTMNFVGAGVVATDVGGVATINIPGGIGGVDIEDDGVAVPPGGFSTFNFIGAGVTAADGGGGVIDVTIPGGLTGIAIENDGVPVAGSFDTLDFLGDNISAADEGGGVAGVTVVHDGAYLPESWARLAIAANITVGSATLLSAQVSQFFDTFTPRRAGKVIAIQSRIDAGPITAGTLTLTVQINGVDSALTLAHTAGANPNGGGTMLAYASGINYVSGDTIGIRIDTTAGLLPDATLNIEVQLLVVELTP